jgi:hypothetical protein
VKYVRENPRRCAAKHVTGVIARKKLPRNRVSIDGNVIPIDGNPIPIERRGGGHFASFISGSV